MNLYYRKLGQGKPLIILHGLFGSSDNWLSVAKSMTNNFEIILPDQRNHGNSFHHPEHTYTDLINDITNFCVSFSLPRPGPTETTSDHLILSLSSSIFFSDRYSLPSSS